PITGIPVIGKTRWGGRPIHKAVRVQDGHSDAEQRCLDLLWSVACAPEGQTCRYVVIGYAALADRLRLARNNAIAAIRGLREKLAVDVAAVATHAKPATYRVYPYREILQRREAAGL